ncbi:autotransporter outer membrane beta-barrel domain-containing protein [Paraburkholderia phenazinium]|uniref:autotransporter outer membrane beta-barrel domain-containing protein n=1 Tax=Paraburkholderia phenazinium TaxID=60549 RepID=UPI00158F3978|nr:autotransporter outer membrane beta-barrel domain-containing protein [Paraburkholderia phenazinium]
MNIVFKTVWNRSMQSFVAASELASGAAKSSVARRNRTRRDGVVGNGNAAGMSRYVIAIGVRALVLATGVVSQGAWAASTCNTGAAGQTSLPAGGGTCVLPDYTPTANSGGVGAAVVSGADTVTLSGTPDFQSGAGAVSFVPASTVTPISGSFNSSAVSLGTQSNAVAGPNSATGSTTVYSTYNSSNITDFPNENALVTQYGNTNGQTYIGASLGSVSASGGTLNVDIGSAPAAAPATNLINLVDKQSDLVTADGTGTASSSVVWQSRNEIIMGANPNLATVNPANGQLTDTINVTTYAGTVTFQGTTYTVTNAAQLAAYNNALIAALQNGSLTSQSAYDAAFNQGFRTAQQTVTYASNTTAGDAARAPNGDQYAILANGARASATIAAGGQIDMWYAEGAIKATNGATVVNNGTLSGTLISAVVNVQSGASFVNGASGVVSAGYLAGDSFNTATGSAAFYNTGQGVMASGAGTTVQNNGIVNVAGFGVPSATAIGLGVYDGAAATNTGIINAGVNPGFVTPLYGVQVGNATFVNAANGVIYLGRAAQYTPEDPTVDVAITAPTYGIGVLNGGVATNDGTITIGSQAQNAVAMYAGAAVGASLVNNGRIDIDGAAGGTPLANIGMAAVDNGSASASGSSVVTNNGSINVNGVNGIGMLVQADAGQSANATSNGVINVAGSADPSSGTRNFGMWVTGAGAIGTINGALNLSGTGAIGAFAQNGGRIDVTRNAVPQFSGGTDQIGFYATGAGSTLNVGAQNLTVNTQGSTLFRVADGATYAGPSSANPLNVTVAGTDARGVVATGGGTTLSTGSSSYSVSGAAGTAGGAVAIVDEGGATGTVDSATSISLQNTGSIAGIVDGQAHDLNGIATGAPVSTLLTSNAAVTSSTNGVTGFVAQNLGTLVNIGNIQLSGAGSTGVMIGSQGALNNTAAIDVSNGTGVLVAGAGSSLVNGGTIEADNGTAGIRLTGAGASLTMSGNGVVKAAGSADGIQLDATDSGGMVRVTNGTISVGGTGQGIEILAPNTAVALAGTAVNTTGAAAAGLRVDSGSAAAGTASQIAVTGGSIASAAGDAIDVNGASAAIALTGGARLSAGTGVLLNATNGSAVTLTANDETLTGNLLADSTSNVSASLLNGTILTGMIDPVALSIDSTSRWNVTANSSLSSLTNAGTVAFAAPSGAATLASSYKTLSVGNYAGNNGTLAINTHLGSDTSPTDQLVINGGAATGTTALAVHNAGGSGALTTGDGIEVVAALNGATTAATAFHLAGPVQAGAYQYLLYRGGSDDTSNWYLRSNLAPTNLTQTGGDGPSSVSTPAAPGPIAYRPGVAGYVMTPLLNVDYGFSLLGTLQERVGDIASVEQQSGNSSGIWGRLGGESLDANADNRFSADERTFFAQFGKDWTLSQTPHGGSTHAGVTVTIGSSSASFDDSLRSINSTLSTSTGSSELQAQSLGAYYTKYLQGGGYSDTVGQVTHYHNRYGDDAGESASQNGFGFAVSEEAGKAFQLGSSAAAIEPQAQLMYQYVNLGGFNDQVSGVSGMVTNALRGRIGMRIFRANLQNSTGSSAATPYFTADILHDFLAPGRTSIGGTTFDPTPGRTWGELGVGVTVSYGNSGEMYAKVAYQRNLSGQYRQGVVGQLGYRYSW